MTDAFPALSLAGKRALVTGPLARFGRRDDLAGAAVFLCSEASAYVTGICLPIDGGTLAAI